MGDSHRSAVFAPVSRRVGFLQATQGAVSYTHLDVYKRQIQNVAVPEMQIKLRQGFGRAIRTETDTCVIAILDERASHGRRYYAAMRDALPDMRTTSSLRAVTKFLRELKPESYFEVCA